MICLVITGGIALKLGSFLLACKCKSVDIISGAQSTRRTKFPDNTALLSVDQSWCWSIRPRRCGDATLGSTCEQSHTQRHHPRARVEDFLFSRMSCVPFK